jgi:hypothetical protein
MKKMSNGAKFLLACAAVFVLGAILAIVGALTGGTEYFDNDTKKMPDTETSSYDLSFNSIEATGCTDVILVGTRYYDEVLEDHEINGIEPQKGRVIVIRQVDKDVPEVKAEGDTLKINGGSTEFALGDFDLFEPTVIVFCGDDELKSIKVSSEASDIEVKGVKFAAADIGLNSGDAEFKDVVSGGIKVEDDAGDIMVSGMLNGTTDIHTEAGDVEVNVADGIRSYTIDIRADAGSIEVGEQEIEGTTFTQEGGDRVLKLISNAGEIEVGQD